MLQRIRNLRKPKVETLNTISLSKNNIINNVKLIKSLKPSSWIFPVLKSNAYGHWILQMLEILKDEKFPYLVVDSFPEYQIIHNNSKFNIFCTNYIKVWSSSLSVWMWMFPLFVFYHIPSAEIIVCNGIVLV